MAADPARRVAYAVLRAVDERDAYANLELARLRLEYRLDARDAAFATELAAGTLRHLGGYDAIIDSLVQRSLQPEVRDLLRLGAHQLLQMRVPEHAAVDATVGLTKAVVGHRPGGLVNAVLRRIAETPLDQWWERIGADLSVRTSHPAWVVEALEEALASPEELPALLEADNRAPTVTLVARPGLCDRAELPGTPLAISPYAVESAGGDPGTLPAIRDGRAGVQDAGSQLVALALTAAPVAHDRAWLDVCAGPGGKAALLQALADQSGAGDASITLVANEPAAHRAALVRSAGVRRVVRADGTRPAWPARRFDRVLVDAPCSGLGALRRRPEARWRRTAADLPGLVTQQRSLLAAAIGSAAPGGVVAYATCSPVLAETVEVVQQALTQHSHVSLIDAPSLLPWVADARSAHLPEAVQLWPYRHGTDAMFVSLLRVEG